MVTYFKGWGSETISPAAKIAVLDSPALVERLRVRAWYGALDNNAFPLHNRDISGSITLMGRFSIQYTGMLVQQLMEKLFGKGNYIIYNDTDSCTGDTNIIVKNLYEVTYEDGSKKYLIKEGK